MVLIAESGSTKTDWVILNQTESTFSSRGLNPYFLDAKKVSEEIKPYFESELKEKVSTIYFYGTGITDPGKGAIIEEGISMALGYKPKIYTYSDVVAAARSLFGNSSGIACILGTGSNSCFWDGHQTAYQVPPLGFWLGDEGSGGHLGKSLILSYLHKEMPAELIKTFNNKYGAKDRLEILNHAYQQPKPNRYFASYSEFIYENLQNQFCIDLIESSFKLFFQKYLLKYPQVYQNPIGAVGSIAHFYKDSLKKVANEYDLEITQIVRKPIYELINFHK